MKQQSIGCCVVTYYFRFARISAHLTVSVGLRCHIIGFSYEPAPPRAVAKAIESARSCRWLSESETAGLSSLAKGGLLGA